MLNWLLTIVQEKSLLWVFFRMWSMGKILIPYNRLSFNGSAHFKSLQKQTFKYNSTYIEKNIYQQWIFFVEVNACLDPDKARLINMSLCVFNLSISNKKTQQLYFSFEKCL